MKNNWKIKVTLSKESINEWVFGVELIKEDAEYSYLVSLDKSYHKKLTDGNIVPLVLVQQTFLFLLSREEPTDILSKFDLKDVTTYFKDFEDEIKNKAHDAK